MIHSGSRTIGQAIRGYYVSVGRKTGSLIALDADTDVGRAYLADVQWARQYADANRRAMANRVAKILWELLRVHSVESQTITCDHNHVARELHEGQELWVRRKGAAPADAGVEGIIPGSMGTLSYHVEGRGNEEALRSSAHGAGRAFSRDAARRQFTARISAGRCAASGSIRAMQTGCAMNRRAPIKTFGRSCAQTDLVRIVRTLKPRLIYKGT